MITYNDIYEAARKERYSEQLQPLPKNFIQEVAEYFREKKEISAKEDNLFSDVIIKTKKQFENAVTIFKELMLRRRKKLLNFVFIASETGISKRDFENMLPFEKELFEGMMKNIDSAERILSGMLEGEEKEKSKNFFIVFNEDISEFMGFNGEKIGPFIKGQMANLPKEIANILISDGKALLVEE